MLVCVYIAGTYNQDDVDNLLLESLKMKELVHQNVMSLIGVCLDAGTAPFIILPYMTGQYYKKQQYFEISCMH